MQLDGWGTKNLGKIASGEFPAAQVLGHNLQPALHWTEEHKEDLRASNGSAAVSSFEFRLHRLQFLHTLQTAGAWVLLQFMP